MTDPILETPVVTPATDTGNPVDPSHPIKPERTEKEKAEFNLKKNADRVRALGGDPSSILENEPEEDDDEDEVPAWYQKEKSKEATKTALQLADGIQDVDTREKVKQYLNTRIVPSGNPEQDFRDALGAVSSGKNKQVLEEINRYSKPRVVATGGEAPPIHEEEFVPTDAEALMMRPPYNLTKEKVLKARRDSQAKS